MPDLTGERFGRWRVVGPAPSRRTGNSVRRQWRVVCECGTERNVLGTSLRTGESRSCGCAVVAKMLGKRYGRLMVTERAGSARAANGTAATWRARCDCGRVVTVLGGNLRSGATRSCGCLNREVAASRIKHGMARRAVRVPEYAVWAAMITRCTSPRCRGWRDYGGRGIKVCARWRRSFRAFIEDMGRRPSATHSIERINNNRGYEPRNCRWATRVEQARNSRRTRWIKVDGVARTAAEWEAITGVPRSIIYYRRRNGIAARIAVTAPKGSLFAGRPRARS